MAKLFLRDVGSHPERDLEVTLFQDGELQFESDNGKYVHINITRVDVKELLDFLTKEVRQKQSAAGVFACDVDGCEKPGVVHLCEDHGLQ